jgi:TRAP-type C4-dicarboxylate transport system permease small subunit
VKWFIHSTIKLSLFLERHAVAGAKSMTATTRIQRIIGQISVAIGAAALLAFGALMTTGVAMRLSDGVITGAAEISEMLVIVMASMSLLAATVYGAHPFVHMLVDKLQTNTKRRVAMFVAALSCAFWAIASFVNGRVAFENWRLIEETELLRISVIPFRLIWTAALALIAIILLIRAFKTDSAEGSGH